MTHRSSAVSCTDQTDYKWVRTIGLRILKLRTRGKTRSKFCHHYWLEWHRKETSPLSSCQSLNPLRLNLLLFQGKIIFTSMEGWLLDILPVKIFEKFFFLTNGTAALQFSGCSLNFLELSVLLRRLLFHGTRQT